MRWGAQPTGAPSAMGKHRAPLPEWSVAYGRAGAEGTEMTLRTPQAPLLCTGFGGSVLHGAVKDLFAWGGSDDKVDGGADGGDDGGADGGADGSSDKVDGGADGDADGGADGGDDGGGGCAAGSPLLNEHDESTKTPGLFLAGPAVRHGELSFCFVYKFRQRFGVVADAIARQLGRETDQAVEACRKMNMFLDDLSCCKAACGESC